MFAALPVLAALCVFSSCASTPTDTGNPPGDSAAASPSDSALLANDDKVGATDVTDSAGAFSDLDSAKKDKTESAAAAPAAGGDTYYSSVGGETLRRVAVTLYSNKSFAKQLLEKNPDLKGVKKLAADQKVYFDMDSARPEPRYLTKDLLNRYAQPLSERVNSNATQKGMGMTSVTVNKGETLQDVSQRLYGTHRYWTEIYLVNHDKIQNYDRVPAGLTLSVISRPNTGIAKAENETPAALARTEAPVDVAPPPAPAPEVKPVPVVAPVAAVIPPPAPIQVPTPTTHPEPVAVAPTPTPMDPIPETPPAPAPVVEKANVPTPTPIAEMPKPPMPSHVDAPLEQSSNSSLRRILYVVLILSIGGAAFYFTRTPKRPKSDLMDLNTEAQRPKLPKDTQKSNIG
ncbi:MAG: hypothetical protein ACXWR4_04725 [Bdellovibrionota bacterium]